MTDYRTIIRAWWSEHVGARDKPVARALAARLNRPGVIEALCEPSVHALAGRLGIRAPERLVPLVQVLAAVRVDAGGPLARRLGGPEPALSRLRFQRLIQSEGFELATLLRRSLPMVERACDVGRLGADILYWGDGVRARWCFEYFGALPPGDDTPKEETQDADEGARA